MQPGLDRTARRAVVRQRGARLRPTPPWGGRSGTESVPRACRTARGTASGRSKPHGLLRRSRPRPATEDVRHEGRSHDCQRQLDKLLDKKFETVDLHARPDAPVDALAGVSRSDADALEKAFGIKTIGDLGRSPQIRAAVAITSLGEASR